MNGIELRPTYWASISGGKDSFYMLYLILQNLDKYPLDGVVHYELEIDFPFIKNVIDYIEEECKKHGIPMFRIKPEQTWEYLYNTKYASGGKWLYPTRKARWCNSKYKLSCSRQLVQMMKAQGKKVVYYIGFCADEPKRFKANLFEREVNTTQIYPLAEMGIYEDDIWAWAKTQPIYNDYYKYNRRCGCMACPMSDFKNLVYLKKYYPAQFDYFMEKATFTERERERELGRPFSVWASDPKYNTDYKVRRVNEIIRLEELTGEQMSFFDDEEGEFDEYFEI